MQKKCSETETGKFAKNDYSEEKNCNFEKENQEQIFAILQKIWSTTTIFDFAKKMDQDDTLQIVKKWIENIREIITFQSVIFPNKIFVQQIPVLYQNIWQNPDIA